MNLTSPAEIKDLMQRYDLHFTKRFGQNFLIDSNIVEKIADAAQIEKDDLVIEIGPGIGTLTAALAKRADKVITIEIDKKLIPVLEETLKDYDNITVINEDILQTDLNNLLKKPIEEGKNIRIAANLPYYITTPIIMSLLESDLPIKSMSFLIQKEVADRMAAKPGSKTYGALSVVGQYYADVKKAFDVPASVFMPRPKVDSALITLTKHQNTLPVDVKKEDYFKVVKAAFANRRKTLLNSLSSNLNIDKKEIESTLESIGISPKLRAEKLSDQDFEKITKALFPPEKEAMNENKNTGISPLIIESPFSNKVELKTQPKRIIALAPVITKTFIDLKSQNLLIGTVATFGEEETLKNLTIVGSYKNPDIEKILELKPDLVIGSDSVDEKYENVFSSNNIPYLCFYPSTFSEVMEFIEIIGEICRKREKASELTTRLKQESFNFRARLKNKRLLDRISERSVFIDLGNFRTAGPNTLLNNELELINAENIGDQKDSQYPTFTPEEIIEEDPQVYISIGTPLEELEENYGFSKLTAFTQDRAYYIKNPSVEADNIKLPGPNIVEGIKLLANLIYPEVVKKIIFQFD